MKMDGRCSRSSVILRVLKCRSHIVSARRLKRRPLLYALFCLTSTRKMTCAEGSTNNKSGRIHEKGISGHQNSKHIAWFEVPAGGGWQRVWDLKFWRAHGKHANMAISKQSRAFILSFPHQFHNTGSFSLLGIFAYH